MDYAVLWFLLLGVLMMGYAILDGFDLGVGILHPLLRDDQERRLALNSIGPLWDGNEVWLVTFGGALFAAFPIAYATALSALYLPVMVILFSLIGRAISIEFRSKSSSPFWRRYWDFSFFLSSATATFLFGLALGNVIRGIPLGQDHEFTGSLGDLIDGFSVAVGMLAVAGAAMHGSIYLYLKTEGALQKRVHRWMWITFFAFAGVYVLVSILALVSLPHATDNLRRWPIAWFVVVLNVLAVANIPRAIHQGNPGWAFVSSSATIAALTFMVGMTLFPHLVVATTAEHSLTLWRASSSDATLRLMAGVAFIGMPLVATYTGIVYWVFRGKVKLDHSSY